LRLVAKIPLQFLEIDRFHAFASASIQEHRDQAPFPVRIAAERSSKFSVRLIPGGELTSGAALAQPQGLPWRALRLRWIKRALPQFCQARLLSQQVHKRAAGAMRSPRLFGSRLRLMFGQIATRLGRPALGSHRRGYSARRLR
jgi:hypothetical protein